MIQKIARYLWSRVEGALLPTFEGSKCTSRWPDMLLRWIQGIIALPFAILCSLFSWRPHFVLSTQMKKIEEFKGDLHSIPIGVTSCEYQYSGKENCPASQWAQFEDQFMPENIHSGNVVDLWNSSDELIQALQDLGIKNYRFSVEWSKIEPFVGEYSQSAIDHYVALADKLIDVGIEPMVTLHHFSEPVWFHQLGGFEKKENLVYFMKFVEVMSKDLKCVMKWCTINEPCIYAFCGYVLGNFPPGEKGNFRIAGKVLGNLLEAHIAAYDILKSRSVENQVGIAHQFLRFTPASKWTKLFCRYLSDITNEIFLDILGGKVGHLRVPFLANQVIKTSRPIQETLDWMGLQYYTRPLVSLKGSTRLEGEEMTQMPFREDPYGLFQALCELHKICPGKDLVVTETGISTSCEDQRERYLTGSLKTIAYAKQQGIPIIGAYAWTLADNFEWDKGYGTQSFGLCDHDSLTGKYTLRKGAKHFFQPPSQ